jgi:hypothetical protein
MIKLADGRLSLTFPEIARPLRAHVGRQIGHISPSSCVPRNASLCSRFSVGEGLIRQFQVPVGRSLLAKALQPDYPFPMPAAVRREFTLQALDGALAAAARQVRESLTKK